MKYIIILQICYHSFKNWSHKPALLIGTPFVFLKHASVDDFSYSYRNYFVFLKHAILATFTGIILYIAQKTCQPTISSIPLYIKEYSLTTTALRQTSQTSNWSLASLSPPPHTHTHKRTRTSELWDSPLVVFSYNSSSNQGQSANPKKQKLRRHVLLPSPFKTIACSSPHTTFINS